ncbi:hypothetical protein, partial [Leptolyngbya sp. PCC 6406]|uniref:hypothetical protein n=1 Tax=Leptolyngbya sp. PCC 6406 TaxID=1173264 RepID=UPI001CED99EA
VVVVNPRIPRMPGAEEVTVAIVTEPVPVAAAALVIALTIFKSSIALPFCKGSMKADVFSYSKSFLMP